ncbi:MAG TPA: SurA N-terminal domain-containing protein [Thermodesulfovibrionales bacterium]|nr:SurA N-terminal domain-containing protein [Thermodesulfovibrionales bacterium]
MLKTMRHHAKYFYVLFFVVILSFIFWGVGTVDKSSNAQIVAEVGKYRISTQDYARVYEGMLKFYRDLYKDKFDDEMQKKLNIKEKAIDTLVSQTVLLVAAQDTGIAVSDAELKEAIVNEPAFMRDGVFDASVYQNVLRYSQLTPGMYEGKKREELLIGKMTRLIQTAALTPDAGLGAISADDQTKKMILDAMTNDAKEKAVQAYVEGYKKKIKVKINTQLL